MTNERIDAVLKRHAPAISALVRDLENEVGPLPSAEAQEDDDDELDYSLRDALINTARLIG